MTLSEKIAAAAEQAKTNEAEAYSTLEFILRQRQWPEWLNSVAADIDRPINVENNQ